MALRLRPSCVCSALLITSLQVVSFAATYCLPNAVPASQRKNLTSELGSYPIGVWVNGWPAGYVTSAVVHILLEEKIGFHTVETGPGPNTVDGFYALTGCATPLDLQDRGCSETMTTLNHICVEGWTESYASTLAQLERDYPQNAPRNLGNMGYFGKTSFFLPSSIQRVAYDEEGWILEFYRGYNKTADSVAKYFDQPSAVNTSLLKRCAETRLMVSQAMEIYVNVTQDWEGVERVNGTLQGRCWDEHFWHAPSCRDQPSKCLMFITGGSGWNLEETMQKATAWNMPVTPVVAQSWDIFTRLPLQHKSTFYWWVPDPTFLSLNPTEIVFPPFDRAAHARGDQRTSPSGLSIDKLVSQDLQTLAPSAYQLMRGFLLDLEAVNDMLRDQLATGETSWDVACRWLQQHQDLWEAWLPDPTKCFAGFGLYHQPSKRFVGDREDPTGVVCQACPSGSFSSKLSDKSGVTFICQPCPPGTKQLSGASLQCELCPAGEYQDMEGSMSCKKCGLGEYQDQKGSIGCLKCPAGTSTYSMGSELLRLCGCREGTIDVSLAADSQAQCIPCSEGLQCPLGSSLDSLKSGRSSLGVSVPTVLQGYFSTENEPTAIFKCPQEHCPGGLPGQCASTREVAMIPCAECPRGTSWNGDDCIACSDGVSIGWTFACGLFFLGLTMSYYILRPKIAATATPMEAMTMILGITGSLAQTLAIVGLTTVKWPDAFMAIAGPSQVFLLEFDSFSIACFANFGPSLRYVGTTLLFPVGVLWLLMCFSSSAWLCKHKNKWTLTRTINTAGLFLQEGFGTMSALALKPLMCYQHPNNQYSLLKNPGVFCDSPERLVMLVAGLILLVFFVLNFLGVCTWAAWNIPRWSVKRPERVASFSFLVNRFQTYRWWFGVPHLARGTFLSLVPVLATDFPPAQAALVILVTASFLVMHMRLLPWKMPLVNLLEGWVLLMLLFLVTITPTFDASVLGLEEFNQAAAVVFLISMALSLGLVVFIVLMAVLHNLVKGTKSDGDFVLLNLGRRPNSKKLLAKMQEVAADLLRIDAEQAHTGFHSLYPGDLGRISDSIDMISTDLLGTYRQNALSMNRVITFSSAHQKVRSSMASVTGEPIVTTHSDSDSLETEEFEKLAELDPVADGSDRNESSCFDADDVVHEGILEAPWSSTRNTL